VRLTALEQAHLIGTFAAAFDGYWNDAAYEPYDPGRDGDRLRGAIAAERGGPTDLPIEITSLDVRPYGYQQEMLDALAAERQIHGRWQNLVVAATGTGKTVLAALDYAGLRGSGRVDRLLFVAHREELLQQSLSTFRHVLREGAFGELFVRGPAPRSGTTSSPRYSRSANSTSTDSTQPGSTWSSSTSSITRWRRPTRGCSTTFAPACCSA